MHLILFSGFLGSGKTTAVLALARAASASGRRLAIVVNEIGEIGIDNQVMRQLDLDVWQLLSGCICCTLSSDLVSMLEKLSANYAPDIVIVEPSGVADPNSILGVLPYYRGTPLDSIRVISVLDPLRLQALLPFLTPLILSQIKHATVILVSKCDLATPEQVAFAHRTVQEHNPAARVVDVGPGATLDGVAASLLP